MTGQDDRYRFLAEASSILASSLDYETTLKSVAGIVVPHLGDWCAVHLVDTAGETHELAVEHVDPRKVEFARELQRRYPADPTADGGVPGVVRTGKSVLITDIPDEMLAASARDADHLSLLRTLQFHSVLIVPLSARGKTLGAITLVAAESGRRYTAEDLSLAEDLAHRAAMAIDNARLHQEMRAAQERLREREERFRLLFESNPHPMWVYDLDTLEFLEVNDATVAQYGYSRAEFLEMRVPEILPAETSEGPLDESHRPGLEQRAASRHRQKDGQIIDVEVSSQPLEFAHRNGCLILAQDVTDRNRIGEIERANVDLERASRMKSAFLANMSHELRTPLNAIIGFSEVLQDEVFGALNDRQRRYVGNILESGQHLLQLVNDILDISKVEAGRMELHREPVLLAPALQNTVGTCMPLAQKKGVDLLCDSPHLDVTIDVDRARFSQVMYNLLSNAIKFTAPNGCVTVTTELRAERIAITVTDTGIGIAEADLARIFMSFEQVDSSFARGEQGTGLGLALTKQLVEMHAGTIEVQSVPGSGSAFTVILPALLWSETGKAGVQIVVVEDERSAQELLHLYLTGAGYGVVFVDRMEDVVERVREVKPAAVTLDLRIHDELTWPVLEQLKADPATRDVPIVIVSILDEQRMAFSLGANAYLVKPVGRRDLLETLSHVCPHADGGEMPGLSILAVDDVVESLEVLELALQQTPHRLVRATNGADALQILARERPDVCVVDLMMAPMSGYDLIDAIQSDEAARDIPIIVMTAKDLTREDLIHLDGRAQSVVSKQGFQRERLLQELERIMHVRVC